MVVICFMKTLLPTTIIAMLLGCSIEPQAPVVVQPEVARSTEKIFEVLTIAPDAILDEMASKYSGSNQEWREAWKYDNSKIALDGQQTIRLLEIACYADVMCHSIEYPLRVATLDYVESNLTTEGVRDALKWIRESYKSDLPLDAPGDDTGQFRGMLVESMQIRMVDYVKELLNPEVPSQHRK
jgi:hypothetical protein